MKALRVVLIVIACLLLAAHFSRAGSSLPVLVSAALPLLLIVGKPWSGWVLRIALLLGGLEWLRTAVRLVGERRAAGDDYARLVLILVVVALVTFLAALAVRIPPAQDPSAGGDHSS